MICRRCKERFLQEEAEFIGRHFDEFEFGTICLPCASEVWKEREAELANLPPLTEPPMEMAGPNDIPF